MENLTIDTAQYEEIARARLNELREQARLVIQERPELGPLEELPLVDGDGPPYTWDGKVLFTGFGIWQRIQMCCYTEQPIQATSDVWGLTTYAVGISFGKYMFNVPFTKLPTMDNIHILPTITPVAVQISFWDGPTAFGMFAGGGIGTGVGVLGGYAKFVYGAC